MNRRANMPFSGILLAAISLLLLIPMGANATDLTLVTHGSSHAVIVLGAEPGPLARKAAAIFQSRVKHRTGATLPIQSLQTAAKLPPATAVVVIGDPRDPAIAGWSKQAGITLPTGDELGEEGFQLQVSGQKLLIVANEGRALLYGVGKVLHTGKYGQGSLAAAVQPGIEKPKLPTRVLYLATHFDNYYEIEPAAVINSLLEEAALWGINAVSVCLDQTEYNDPFDPQVDGSKGKAVWDKDKGILRLAQALGLAADYTTSPNVIYLNQAKRYPEVIAPQPRPEHGIALADPTIPKGRQLILDDVGNILHDAAKDGIKLDEVVTFPYDWGGCLSEACKPWILTFMKLSQSLAPSIRQYQPNAKVYVADWVCDWPFYTQTTGEIKMLINFLNDQKTPQLMGVWEDPNHPFTDYNSLSPQYDKFSFQDITMIGGWGGLGANPFPGFFRKIFTQMDRNNFKGYMSYTEGIFDDFNDAYTAQLGWNPQENPEEFEREYCNYYFSDRIASSFVAIVQAMDDSWSGSRLRRDHSLRLTADLPQAARLASITAAAAAQLPADVRASWRWQIYDRRAKLELTAVKLHDPAAFAAEMKRQSDSGTAKAVLERRLKEKQAEVHAYVDAVHNLAAQVYREPSTRNPPMPTAGGPNDATANEVGVSLRGWNETFEQLQTSLGLKKPAAQASLEGAAK